MATTLTGKQERNGVPGASDGHNSAVPVVPDLTGQIASELRSAQSTASYQSPITVEGTGA